MEEIVKHINDTNASYRSPKAGDAKNTDLFFDNEHYQLFEDSGEQITVRYSKENLTKAILFIASLLPRKYDNSAVHKIIPFSKDFVLEQIELLDGYFMVDGVAVNYKTQIWNARKDVLKKNGEIDNRFYFNGLIEEFLYKDSNGIYQKAKFTIRNYLAGGYSDIHIKKGEDGIFDVWVTNTLEYKDDGKEQKYEELGSFSLNPLQQIFYGAPGTGKSNTIKREVDEKKKICFRTTFHPDSDYSTFVGCYKPTMKKQYRFDERMRSKDYEDGDLFGAKEDEIIIDKVIHYDFVPQAFTKAYVKAWQNPKEQVFLIIEEINRGNCAQIFGDIFQLLDRNEHGLSDYPIKADDDLKAHLRECFRNNDNLKDNIKSGDELQLPSNLYIWATMNTSDQSLFPIDSAFKRRWDWTYMPIYDAKKGWKIEVNGKRYGWWSFLEKINEKIGTTTSSEDKKLGYFFCKADDNGIISAEKFVGKVIFYLWNDVFKDYAEDSSVFVDEANKAITFDKFYMADSEGRAIVATNMVETFLKNLVVEADTSIEKDEEISSTNTTITVNGKAVKYVNAIPYTTIEEYKILHPNKTAQEIIDVWKDFSKYSMRTWIVCNKDEHEKMDARYANYSYKIDCADGESLWVNKDGWMYHPKNSELRDTISEFIKAVNEANLGIEIKETSIE